MNINYCNKCGNKFYCKNNFYNKCDECQFDCYKIKYCVQCGKEVDDDNICCVETRYNMIKSKIYFMLYILFSIISIMYCIMYLFIN